MERKSNFAGFACFIALLSATVLFVLEYVFNMQATSWAKYIMIAKDVAVAAGIIFGSLGYIKNKGFIVKLLFMLTVLIYIAFAVLTVIY